MPFIPQDERRWVDKFVENKGDIPAAITVGQLCYVAYRAMVKRWTLNPRWTTAHAIYKDMSTNPPPTNTDVAVARELAWQVFFQMHVMPYEYQKREENGDVTG